MKKLLLSLFAFSVVSVALAQQSASPIMRFLPLISGYNIAVSNSVVATPATIGYGTSNVMFTTYSGLVEFSDQTNNMNTNGPSYGDAFQYASLKPDVNGDFASNACVYIQIGNTNYIPIWGTNSVGQYIITTNASGVYWPLAPINYTEFMLPATTNTYPSYTAAATNTLLFSFYRAPATTLNGGGGSVNPSNPMWETTPAFTITIVPTGVTGLTTNVPVPLSWLNGASLVKVTVNATGTATGTLLNMIGFSQPQP